MKLLPRTDTADIEAQLPELLRASTDRLHLDPPDWEELLARPATAAVVVLPTAADGAAAGSVVRTRYRPRPVFVAAAAVAVALAIGGGVATNGGGSTPTPLTQDPTSFTAAAPTDAAFDASTAPVVWASELEDPVAAATSYLEAAGLGNPVPGTPDLPAAAGVPTVTLVEAEGGTAVVAWAVVDGSVVQEGTVLLRSTAEAATGAATEAATGAAAAGWAVVGATADGVAIEDVRYDGELLSFSVTRTSDVGGELAVSVRSDGQPVLLDPAQVAPATDVPDAGEVPAPSWGQVVDVAEGAGSHVPIEVAAAQDTTTVVRVHHLVDGRVTSVTEMAVDIPGGAASAQADASGAAEADGPVTTPAVPDDVPSLADGEVPTTLPDGAPLPLPGAGDVTLPEVPSSTVPPVTAPELPVDPTLPRPTTPTTLPIDLP